MNNILQHSPVKLQKVLREIKGGNSTVYKCLAKDSKKYAVKVLEGTKTRQDSAITRQIKAVYHLEGSSIYHPALIAVNPDKAILVFEWVEGRHPNPSENLALEFIRVISVLKEIYLENNESLIAADALEDFTIEILNIENRCALLQRFFSDDFFQIWSLELHARLDKIKQVCANLRFELDTLSFSDFGSHNILQSNDRFYFLDFEFFGSDSSYKMIADIVLHPQNTFSIKNNLLLVDKISKLFSHEESKLKLVLMLLSLKWSTIAFKRFSAVNVKDVRHLSYKLAMTYIDIFDQVEKSNLLQGISAIHDSLLKTRTI